MQVRRGDTVLTAIETYVDDLAEWIKGGCEGTKPEPKWRYYKMFPSKTDITVGLSYITHREDVIRLRSHAGVTNKGAVTHLERIEEVCKALEADEDIRNVETAGGWRLQTEAQKTYGKGALVSSVLMRFAGWEGGKDGYACAWEGAKTDIYPELLATVFPNLDTIGSKIIAIKEFSLSEVNTEFKVITVNDWYPEYLTLKAFDYYRQVFIEDAVYMQSKYPTWPAYETHPLFNHELWPIYASEEKIRVSNRTNKYFAVTPEGKFEILKGLIVRQINGSKKRKVGH